MSSDKKIIVISPRKGSDFSMDLLFAGLVMHFGPENVIDFPQQQRHRNGIPKLTGNIEIDYGLERQSLCYTGKESDLKNYDLESIRDLIRSGKITHVFCDEQEESYKKYLELRLNFFPIPVTVIAGHDRFWNVSPKFVKESYYRDKLNKIFVDDWQSEYDELSYVKLTNLSTNYDHLWNVSERESLLADKKFDICFIGYNSHPDRKFYIDHVKKRWGHLNNCVFFEETPNVMNNFCLRRDYFKAIAQSKICLNLRGASVCGRALRYYEIPYVGSFMATQRFPARLIYPYDETMCKMFSSSYELDEIVEWALNNENDRELFAAKAHEHSNEYHTVRARISNILKDCS